MADGADPHRATGAPPRRGRGTPRRAGDRRRPLTAEEGIGLPRFGLGNLRPLPVTNRFAPLLVDLEDDAAGPDPEPPLRHLGDVAAGPEPAPLADAVRRRPHHRRYRLRRSGAGSQASSSAASTMDGGSQASSSTAPTMDGGSQASSSAAPRPTMDGGSQASSSTAPTMGRGSQASSSAAPAPFSDHPGALGRIRVRQSVLYSDRPRHSRPRRLASSEASTVRSRELQRPLMDLQTFEALSLGDPSLSTTETAEMTNADYAPRSEQEERTRVVNSSEVDTEDIEALSLRDPPLLTPPTETDEESTDDDCAWVPPTRQTKFFFNRPKGISRAMVLSTPLFITVPNVVEDKPKLYSDVDPKDVQRMVKEYLDARPCINLDIAPDSILAMEEALDTRAGELGTEPQLPSVITEQDSVAAAHRQHSMVPTESRHEASAEEIILTGTTWMEEEVMLCFKKHIAISRRLAKLEDYHLDQLQHQCFNVESYEKVYHHYNFTVRMKMPDADWKVNLYFAEVKEVFRKKYYLCYPLDPGENGQCYACKNQGVEDLRHPAIDLYEMGSPDVSCNLWYTDDESDEEPKATRFESDSFDLGVLFGS